MSDNENDEKKPEETKKLNAMIGISGIALALAILLILGVLGLVVLAIYNAFGFSSNAYFWIGILSFIIVIIAYPLHMASNSRALLAIVGLFGFFGVVAIYGSIYFGSGSFSDKITPLIIFSIIVIFILLVIYSAAGSAGAQKQRIALRKKT